MPYGAELVITLLSISQETLSLLHEVKSGDPIFF